MQCTITMTKPCKESKTAKRIWKRMERLSVMASTADIQVKASRGRTTHELHKDALEEDGKVCACVCEEGGRGRVNKIRSGELSGISMATCFLQSDSRRLTAYQRLCKAFKDYFYARVLMRRECNQHLNIEHFAVDCSSGHVVHKKKTPCSIVLLIHRHWQALTLHCWL